MKKIKRLFSGAVALLLLFPLLVLSAAADEPTTGTTTAMPDEYTALLEAIPEDLQSLLPEGLFSSDPDEVGDAVREMSDFSRLLQTLLSLVGAKLGDCLSILGSVAGLLILSAVCNAVRSSFRSETVGRAFSFCATLVITLALLTQSYCSIESVTSYFSNLGTLTGAALPLMGALYAMGGNVSVAVVSASGLSIFMTLLETFVCRSIVPFCGVCMAFSLVNSLDPSLRTGTLLSTVKKNYTTALAFLMMLLLAMLATQTTLAARSDTLLMRSAKFAAGNVIPVVGGSVSELLRTVSASVGYLRGTVGICGILLLLLMLLPTLVELLLLRMTWQLSASLADLLGCDTQKKLLDEFASLLGYLVTAVCICSSVLMLSLSLLTHCASAIG